MSCVKINALSYALLINALSKGEWTCQELADQIGLHRLTVYQYTKALHKVGMVHIVRWDKDRLGRDCIVVYKLGKGKDVPRGRKTDAQKQADYKKRVAAKAMIQAMAGVMR